jgi:hypothetical protein
MIVSFCQKHTIRLIAQAQRGFLLFLMVDQGFPKSTIKTVKTLVINNFMRFDFYIKVQAKLPYSLICKGFY